MYEQMCTWEDFKLAASEALSHPGQYLYRGQKNSDWRLSTSLQRTGFLQVPDAWDYYMNSMLLHVHDVVQTWSGRGWDFNQPNSYAEFFAFLQHNGFPTPLLDWTYSPYVAAYFAFEALEHFDNQDGHVAIYRFRGEQWSKDFQQVRDVSVKTPHVSIIKPRTLGNHKLTNQQGCFTLTNVVDIEQHIMSHEKDSNQYIQRFLIKKSERPFVMAELALMGVSAVHLMPSIESVCKKAFDDEMNAIVLRGLARQMSAPSSSV